MLRIWALLFLFVSIVCAENKSSSTFTDTLKRSLGIEVSPETPKDDSKHDELIQSQVADIKQKETLNVREVVKSMTTAENESVLFGHDQVINQLTIEDPDIVDVHLVDNKNVYIYGKKTGKTEVLVQADNKKQNIKIQIFVTPNIDGLTQLIREALPYVGERVNVRATTSGLILEGVVASVSDSKIVEDLANHFIKAKAGDGKIINNLTLGQGQQVALYVKVVEISRSLVQRLGIQWSPNALRVKHPFKFGLMTQNGQALMQDKAMIDVLSQQGLITVLDEPNLVTASGKEASLKVGGEFPVYQRNIGNLTNGGQTTETTTFKPYGLDMSFKPVVTGETVQLDLKASLSDVDESKKNSIGDVVGALFTKSTSTSVVLGSGQSLMIAGLLKSKTTDKSTEDNILSHIPFLSGIFGKPSEHAEDRKEVMIIVTPYIVNPSPDKLHNPLDGIQTHTVQDRFFRGKSIINNASGEPLSSSLRDEAGFMF